MVSELIKLPLRVGVRTTKLWLRVTGAAAEAAFGVAGSVLGRKDSHVDIRWEGGEPADAPEQPPAPPKVSPSNRESQAPVGAEDSAEETVTATVAPGQVAPVQEPVHVSEGAELVEEFSEPGAEDGAGAEVHIQEPWEGYAQCTAKEVIARLAAANAAELAAVQLYESGHRGRQTILAAVEQEMRNANGSGSPRSERNR